MADTEVADDGEYQEDLINDLSDDTYYDTENNCLLLDSYTSFTSGPLCIYLLLRIARFFYEKDIPFHAAR